MAKKRSYIYLYLALACFLGIIAIFVFDGYMGFYERLAITEGESSYDIERSTGDWKSSVSVERGVPVSFRYEIDNRRFSAYEAWVEVSVWRSQVKVADVTTQYVAAAAFGQAQVAWSLDTEALAPAGTTSTQDYELTMLIKAGATEREVIIRFRGSEYTKVVVPEVAIP